MFIVFICSGPLKTINRYNFWS